MFDQHIKRIMFLHFVSFFLSNNLLNNRCSEITTRGELFTNGDVSSHQYENCTNLTHLYIGETTKKIAEYAFSNTNLEYVFGSIQPCTFEKYAFINVSDSLKLTCSNCIVNTEAFPSYNITLKSSLSKIKTNGFVNEINIENGVVFNGVIEPYAFYTDYDLRIGDLKKNLTLNVSNVIINNILDDVFFELKENAYVTITGVIDAFVQSVNEISIELSKTCNGTEFTLENINLLCHDGAFGSFRGEGKDLKIFEGMVDDGVLIHGNFDTIQIGKTGSKNIHMSGGSLDPDITATAIYISSCVNQKFYLNNIDTKNSGLNYTDNQSYPVLDICTPCSTGFFFDVETETGTGECKKCNKNCSRDEFVVTYCTGEIEILCEQCPFGFSNPDNHRFFTCVKSSVTKKERSVLDFFYVGNIVWSACILVYLIFNSRKEKKE